MFSIKSRTKIYRDKNDHSIYYIYAIGCNNYTIIINILGTRLNIFTFSMLICRHFDFFILVCLLSCVCEFPFSKHDVINKYSNIEWLLRAMNLSSNLQHFFVFFPLLLNIHLKKNEEMRDIPTFCMNNLLFRQNIIVWCALSDNWLGQLNVAFSSQLDFIVLFLFWFWTFEKYKTFNFCTLHLWSMWCIRVHDKFYYIHTLIIYT